MATQAQIDANRVNAQHSTGPRSAEGKAVSRFNALKSGLDAQSLIIPGEDPAALEALTTSYHEQFRPSNPLEAHFVDALIRADWTKRRLSLIEANAIRAMLREQPEDEPNPLGAAILCDAAGPNALQKIFRHQNAQERAYLRALAELRRLQAERQFEEQEQALAAVHVQPPARPAQPPPTNSNRPPRRSVRRQNRPNRPQKGRSGSPALITVEARSRAVNHETLYASVELPIEVEALKKSYGSFPAVKGIDFQVHAGEVFGLLGPNGAGKTTTVEVLEGLRSRSGGRVSVLGFDPEVQTRQLKDRIGVCLQATNLQEKIKIREAIELFSSLYTRTVDSVSLLKRLQLWEKRESLYSQLSGGQKQRLALALALLNDPQVLFLDEPSAGLDPQARLEIHELVLDLRREQRTILLTTHYIEEAEKLCDRVAIIDEGRIIALGTPREIQERTLANSIIEIECAQPLPSRELPAWQNAEKVTLDERGVKISVISRHTAKTIVEMVKWLDEKGIELADIRIKRPSLEEAFIELTGKSLRE